MQALAEHSRIVRLPLNKIGWVTKLHNTLQELEQKFEREPTTAELADALDMTVEEVADTLKISARQVSMDAPFSSGDEGSLLDLLEDTNQVTPDHEVLIDSLKMEVNRALSTLTQRENEIVTYYFGLNNQAPLTLEEIGNILSLTRERVRQIKEKAMRRLRYTSRSKSLKTYLG